MDAINLLEKCDIGYEFTQKSFNKYQVEEFDTIEERVKKGYNLTQKVEYKSLNNKNDISFSGRILGGCVDVISIILGTKYDNTLNYIDSCEEGIIWYLDNCELSSMELYRRLWKMKELGWFKNANGFLIGRTSAVKIDYFSFEDALKRALGDLEVPIIYDVDIGHVSPQFIIINGSYAKFEYKDSKGTLIQQLI
jgi:muramoyltetrapeptide carboxypeptidase LdcA involved in peptidoglycan recycling